MSYECSSGTKGKTNASAEYSCLIGDNVTFSLGSLVIGTVPAQTAAITPYTLFPADNNAAINLARLLQSQDALVSDSIIFIDDVLEKKITSSIDFTSATFTADTEALLGITLVSADTAKSSMNQSIISNGGTPPTANNHAPIADAGADQSIETTSTLTLDASASSDSDGDALTYLWAITSKPSTSSATLSDTSLINPTITADVDGTYILELIVNDGNLSSAANSMSITATTSNKVPVATTTTLQTTEDTSLSTTLSATDKNSDTLTYTKVTDTTNGTLSITSRHVQI